MSFGAPDPESFEGVREAFDYIAPAAAIEIVLPAFTFPPSAMQMANLIYMNQCNPGDLMVTGAHWLQLGEKYIAAAQALDDNVSGLDADSWEGDDCDAFVDRAGKVKVQLFTIAAFAIQVGVSLFTIAAVLAVLVTVMAAFATALLAIALVYWPLQCFPPTAGAAQSVRTAGMTVASTGYTILKALDTAVTALAKGLAAFIGGGMTASWAVLATQGNVVNPLEMVGPTAFNMAQGFAQLGLRNAMAPGGGKHAAFGAGNLFMGGQGLYNMGLNYNENENDGAYDPRDETGVDPGNLDFIPEIPPPEWADDDAPDWEGS